MTVRIRRSKDRGFSDHGWLKSRFSFSFADYYDPEFEGFGALRVINEDTVAGGTGFPRHPHANMNIFSYILSGALRHQDSMGNTEILKRGDVQYTEAGTGIAHSEFNAHQQEPVRFLQIWVKPWKTNVPPRYETGNFPDDAKVNTLLPLITPHGTGSPPDGVPGGAIPPHAEGTISIASDFRMFASLLEDGVAVAHDFRAAVPGGPLRRGYLHVPIMDDTKAVVVNNDTRLGPGDALFIDGKQTITVTAETVGGPGSGQRAEFILFDLK